MTGGSRCVKSRPNRALVYQTSRPQSDSEVEPSPKRANKPSRVDGFCIGARITSRNPRGKASV